MSKKMLWTTVTVAVIAVVLIILAVVSGRKNSTLPEKQKGTELVEMVPARGESEKAATDKQQTANQNTTEDDQQYEFLLVDHNDYVAVYQLPEREIYEYTDVIMEVLPEEVQKEVQEGKYIKNEEELYNFLENYTS